MTMKVALKRFARSAARRLSSPARRGLLRLLRPVVLRLDAHLQWLFDRQQEDRARIARLERHVAALQGQPDARRPRAA